MELVRSYDSIRFGLPSILGGSAPASPVSGPAQRSLWLRPHCGYGLHARQVAIATLCTRGFSSLVASTAALIATGWSESVPGRVYPAVDRRLFTAHAKVRLEILHRHDAKATFFLIGERALRHPEVVSQIKAAGHEVGNHYFRNGPTLGHSDADFVD